MAENIEQIVYLDKFFDYFYLFLLFCWYENLTWKDTLQR